MSKDKFAGIKIGNYQFQIKQRLQWYVMRLKGRYDYPKPALYFPLDGWTSDPDEVTQALFDDPAFDVKLERKDKQL